MDALCIIIETNRWIIAAALIMSAVSAYLVGLNNRRNRFATASDKFRSTILKELEGLYPSPAKWPSNNLEIINILQDKFPKLEVAVAEFRGHLGWVDRKRFDNVWQQYNKENYFDYIPISGRSHEKGVCTYSSDYTKTYKDNFKHNVDSLLKFAKH
ncbi:MAG: hypothetical protein HY957_02415 [Nitrospirae bacterium]|nr:hypothetical protein [Nitrospirota bacterium]